MMTSEVKWTPGPWEIQGYTNYTGWAVYTQNRGCIAERWYAQNQKAPYADELKANAYLISAAPDLYAAAEKAECFISGFEGDELQEGIAEMLADLRGAIAKAKGEVSHG
ncbi:hypothetical protein [Roseicella sp. DB1501]|uniref:hypothetical protein n=1 Tax=Roseicella sp. DB1501 TaxID=2730925 RepID=UPI0014914B59|nr:hypothetical protein [Roseicella sp. DB1501]NOG70449.1 hypothetical protein [Roseicella sp. DB1501]